MHLSKGTSLKSGSYVVQTVLGQGGFGITYLAEQTGLGRNVAIKEFFMRDLCNRDTDTSYVSVPSVGSKELVDKFRAKFVKEAQMISEFKHPNIVSIYDIFEENGTAYYVMEYHDGGSLSSLSLPLPVAEAVRYIRQVASALSYLHKRNVMHLDVKPANILIDSEGNAVLIDFGISKRYDESGGQTSSTPVGVSNGYAPIEQYGRTVSKFTPATDVYSLGATFYKLLTGTTPPEASILVCEPESLVIPSSMPKRFAELIRKCLKPNVSGRPQSIDEFINVLDGYVEPSIQEIKPPKKGFEQEISDDETVMPTVNPVNVKKVSSVNVKKVPPVRTAAPSPTKKSRRWLWPALIVGVLAVGAVGFMMLKSGEGQTGDSAFVQHTREVCERVINARTSDEFREARIEADNWFDQLTTEEQRLAKDIAKQYETAIEAQYERFPQQATHYGYDWVDLGLPSGLKWATCNVGACNPEEAGDYFAWGETRPKSSYTRANSTAYGESWGDITGDSSRDAARANWGGSWRMPTKAEFQELIDNCTWTWTTQNGHNGYEVMGRNGYSIFLPAAGYFKSDLGSYGSYCLYWSSTPGPSGTADCAVYASLCEDKRFVDYDDCFRGQSVRPVLED